MTDTTSDAQRYSRHGTAGDDVIHADDVVAFDWQPAPGEHAARVWDEAWHATAEVPSSASGQVFFEGVSAAAPFQSDAVHLAFTFDYGGAVYDPASQGGPWTWDPATETLDPHSLWGYSDVRYDMGGGDYYVASSQNWLLGLDEATASGTNYSLSFGSQSAGHWVLRTAPTPMEVLAGDGADTVSGGQADDRLLGEDGADQLQGGDGDDRPLGGDGRDTLDGGAGSDVLDGQRGDDLILGGYGNDVASGGSGDDTLMGGDGRDTLYGHEGDDLLEGGAGADLLVGGAARGDQAHRGTDTVSYAHSAFGVSVSLASGSGHGGDAEGDRIEGIQNIEGSAFADALTGDGGANEFRGGAGDDTLHGGLGAGRNADGADVAVYAGRAADYRVGLATDGSVTVHDLASADGDEGTDTLIGIERIRFSDGEMDAPVPAHAASPLVFAASTDKAGNEPWVTDGTAQGTQLLQDIVPGQYGSSAWNFVSFGNGLILFTAVDQTHGSEPWVTDGTAAGTHMLRDLAPGAANGADYAFSAAPIGCGLILFEGDDGVHGRELWVTDGTEAGTSLVKDVNPGSNGSDTYGLNATGDGRVLFSADDGVHGKELWTSDGTPDGTSLAVDIVPGAGSVSPEHFSSLSGGRFFFVGDDGVHGREVWATDGTAVGTSMVADLVAADRGSEPWPLFSMGSGRVLFAAYDKVDENGIVNWQNLWATDGTTAGTSLLIGGVDGKGPDAVRVLGGLGEGRALVAVDRSYDLPSELWVTDGTAAGTSMIRGEVGGWSSLDLGNSRALITASDPEHGSEPWITDGTAAGTHILVDATPGPASSSPMFYAPLGDGRVVFTAEAAGAGWELWVTDGTAQGTRLLDDVNPGPYGSGILGFTPVLPGNAAANGEWPNGDAWL